MTARLAGLLAGFVAAEVLQYGTFLASWVLLGHAVLTSGVTGATIAGWAALQAIAVAGFATTVRLQATLAVRVGGALRTRLLTGALRLEPAELTATGSTPLLGRLLEAQTLEDQLIGEALRNLGAPLDLALAAILLAGGLGATGLVALGVWAAVTAWVTRRYATARDRWTAARLALGDDLAARLAGHRTRAVQQPIALRHKGEAAALAGYNRLAAPMDRWHSALTVLVPRGWALTGAVLLCVLATGHASPGALIAAAAGVLFTTAALVRATLALAGVADAAVAYRQLRLLLRAAAGPAPLPGAVPTPDRDHLLLAPLAQNLLLGRGWPASQSDLAEAERVCREIGLGDLIDRMPSGLVQLVGETGWQLSAGERALVFLARARLTRPPLALPDGALDALDPVTRAIAERPPQ